MPCRFFVFIVCVCVYIYIYIYIYVFLSSSSIVINEDHLINLMIEEGICECTDG